MPLSPDLMSILACPSPDHAPLVEQTLSGSPVLVCTVCQTSYPIRDSIPVLLTDDATPGPKGIGVPAEADAP